MAPGDDQPCIIYLRAISLGAGPTMASLGSVWRRLGRVTLVRRRPGRSAMSPSPCSVNIDYCGLMGLVGLLRPSTRPASRWTQLTPRSRAPTRSAWRSRRRRRATASAAMGSSSWWRRSRPARSHPRCAEQSVVEFARSAIVKLCVCRSLMSGPGWCWSRWTELKRLAGASTQSWLGSLRSGASTHTCTHHRTHTRTHTMQTRHTHAHTHTRTHTQCRRVAHNARPTIARHTTLAHAGLAEVWPAGARARDAARRAAGGRCRGRHCGVRAAGVDFQN